MDIFDLLLMSNDVMKEIFEFQKQYQKRIYNVDLPCKDVKLVKNFAMGIFTELGEALAIDKSWKDWRKNQKEVDEPKLREEIADMWNFLINFSLANNMDYDDVITELKKKQIELIRRIEEGEINVSDS